MLYLPHLLLMAMTVILFVVVMTMLMMQEGKFYLDATNPRFTTRSALVSHYKKHYLPQRTVVLTKPYSTVLLTTAHAAATPAVAAAATYI